MAEYIHFNIAYGDTSNPHDIAKSIAESLSLVEWRVSNMGDVVDDKIVSTKWRVEGWHNEPERRNEEKDDILRHRRDDF